MMADHLLQEDSFRVLRIPIPFTLCDSDAVPRLLLKSARRQRLARIDMTGAKKMAATKHHAVLHVVLLLCT